MLAEALYFWERAEDYRRGHPYSSYPFEAQSAKAQSSLYPKSGKNDNQTNYVKAWAGVIYDEFLSEDARYRIPYALSEIDDISIQIRNILGCPPASLFETVQNICYDKMKFKIYPEFAKQEHYRKDFQSVIRGTKSTSAVRYLICKVVFITQLRADDIFPFRLCLQASSAQKAMRESEIAILNSNKKSTFSISSFLGIGSRAEVKKNSASATFERYNRVNEQDLVDQEGSTYWRGRETYEDEDVEWLPDYWWSWAEDGLKVHKNRSNKAQPTASALAVRFLRTCLLVV